METSILKSGCEVYKACIAVRQNTLVNKMGMVYVGYQSIS